VCRCANQVTRRSPSIEQVVAFWKQNGLTETTIRYYSNWVRRYLAYCSRKQISPIAALVATEVRNFASLYARRKHLDVKVTKQVAIPSLHAWAHALGSLGLDLPTWSNPATSVRPLCPTLVTFCEYRRRHSNAKEVSIQQEIAHANDFCRFLKSRNRKMRTARLSDIDAYLLHIRGRFAKTTTSNILSSLRVLFRFLHATGRSYYDLADSIQSLARQNSALPRTLPWSDVKRILSAVDRSTKIGRRDYAILLLMSLYGMGAAEIRSLVLDQVCWRSRTLTVIRPKTGARIILPLLPAAARSLAAYLKHSRPPSAPTRAIFVGYFIPHGPLTSCAINSIIRHYAAEAKVQAPILGGHIFRRTHATRQINQQVPPAVLSSILGHQAPHSLAPYARVAIRRLRGIALPVPA
jgi:integrase/recombinase XerD